MSERNDSQLESLLREHLSRKLDGQLGRAAERLAREVAERPPRPTMRVVGAYHAPPPATPARRGWSGFAWSIGIAGGAVAAGMAVVMLLAPVLTNHRPDDHRIIADGGSLRNPRNGGGHSSSIPSGDPNPADTLGPQNVEHALSWRTVDQGTVYLAGELPLRSVVRQANETVRWYDPQRKAHVEMTVPRNEVTLVGYGSQ